MPGENSSLTPPEDTLARVLADAVIDDMVSEAGGLWVAVQCRDETELRELTERFRGEGREVRVRREAA